VVDSKQSELGSQNKVEIVVMALWQLRSHGLN